MLKAVGFTGEISFFWSRNDTSLDQALALTLALALGSTGIHWDILG